METKEKFRLKRQAKLLTIIGYACLIFFALLFISTYIIRSNSEGWWETWVAIIIVIGLLGSLVASGILISTALMYQQHLRVYMKFIQVYRARKFAWKTIEHLLKNETQLAVKEYNKCNWYPEKSLYDNIHGMIVMALYCNSEIGSEDFDKGVKHINRIKDTFNPDKIIFNH